MIIEILGVVAFIGESPDIIHRYQTLSGFQQCYAIFIINIDGRIVDNTTSANPTA